MYTRQAVILLEKITNDKNASDDDKRPCSSFHRSYRNETRTIRDIQESIPTLSTI